MAGNLGRGDLAGNLEGGVPKMARRSFVDRPEFLLEDWQSILQRQCPEIRREVVRARELLRAECGAGGGARGRRRVAEEVVYGKGWLAVGEEDMKEEVGVIGEREGEDRMEVGVGVGERDGG